MIEIMYKVGLKKECLKNSFLSHSMGLFRVRYGMVINGKMLKNEKKNSRKNFILAGKKTVYYKSHEYGFSPKCTLL